MSTEMNMIKAEKVKLSKRLEAIGEQVEENEGDADMVNQQWEIQEMSVYLVIDLRAFVILFYYLKVLFINIINKLLLEIFTEMIDCCRANGFPNATLNVFEFLAIPTG